MDKRTPQNIILTGFSYTGKSQVGKEVARRLGWAFVDTDDLVVALAGKSIEDIFAQEGEERFREWERQAIKKACIRKDAVIATGGGTIVNAQNRELMAQSGIIVCLEAKPNTILSRLEAEAKRTGNPLIRPLLSGDSPLEHIQYLKASRQPHYALADWTVHTDVLSVEEVSQEVLRGWEQVRRTTAPKDKAYTMVHTATASYPIYVGLGLLDELGKRMAQAGLSGTAVIISDSDVFPLHGSQAQAALQEAGFTIHSITVPSGEDSKNLDNATRIYHRLVELRVERGHAIVALGGGMIGDLAGFAAATLLRGLPLVQAPTSLLAMVDAAIGGKVAVNLPQGKNLVGAFYQPRLVLADVATLNTLPKRELISGWAEVAKHALIADPQLLDLMETNASALASLPPALTAQIIRQSAAIKASVVSADEKETGLRMTLNYGHTIGHALEASTGYERFLHGEAVAVGMMGAALLSERLGLIPHSLVERQKSLLERLGLPTRCSQLGIESLLGAMKSDKKVREKTIRWVLLEGAGKTVFRSDVPQEEVIKVLEELVT